MGFTIRRATLADAELVSQLNAEVQRLHAAAIPARFKPPDIVAIAAVFRQWLADADHVVLLAHNEAIPAGYAVLQIVRRDESPFSHARQYLWIDQMGVAQAYYGTGCAQSLMEEARAVARAHGLPEIGLSVHTFNARAQRFYVNEGFRTATETMVYELDA